MFMEMILAGLVAHSANSATARASYALSAQIQAATMKLERHISVVELKVDQLNVKVDSGFAKLADQLEWHDYVQTLHVKGAKYRGNELYVLKENRTVTTANLATRVTKEENGDFTLYKDFNDHTERLYMSGTLIYRKLGNGEVFTYDDAGHLYMHIKNDQEFKMYRPDGKLLSTGWDDGTLWIYSYDSWGNLESIDSYEM